MSLQPPPRLHTAVGEEQSRIEKRMKEMSAELELRYPIPLFEGPSRKPATEWMVVDLVAYAAAPPPRRPVTRTFQARELINDDISMRLSALRAQSFFTEVRKLLIFCGSEGPCGSVWDDRLLNARAVDVQNAKLVAWTDGGTVWNGATTWDFKQPEVLEYGKVVELFDEATSMGLERLSFYVEWYNSSLSQAISLGRRHIWQEVRSAGPRKRLRSKTRSQH